jgi:hypothetical protein
VQGLIDVVTEQTAVCHKWNCLLKQKKDDSCLKVNCLLEQKRMSLVTK